jgi:predicted nucleic acid-binding protein
MDYVLADTGVWYAMFDNRDPHYEEAKEKLEWLTVFPLVLPWPILYETLRTRFVRNKAALTQFNRFLKTPNIIYLDDSAYREDAFELAVESSLRKARPFSMTDCLIRLILDDINVKIDYFATFNLPDFIDVCQKRRVEIL